MNFGNILRLLRKENGISAKELSLKLNCSVNLIYEWEHGRCEPGLNTIINLAKIFDVTLDELMGIENIKSDLQISSLTPKEQRLLRSFALLSEREQDRICEDCEYFARQNTKFEKVIK